MAYGEARAASPAPLRAIRAAVGGAWIHSASLTELGLGPFESGDHSEEFNEAGDHVLIVADGHGAAAASRRCIEALREAFRHSTEPLDVRLRRGFETAAGEIHSDVGLRETGASMVAVAVSWDLSAYLARAGDCRAYRLRDAVLTDIGAEISPSGPLGVGPDGEVDVQPIDIRAGDRLLLCSDGLRALPEAEIARTLELPGPRSMTSQLVRRLRRRDEAANVTVCVAVISEPFPAAAEAGSDAETSAGGSPAVPVAAEPDAARRRLPLAAVGLAAAVVLAAGLGVRFLLGDAERVERGASELPPVSAPAVAEVEAPAPEPPAVEAPQPSPPSEPTGAKLEAQPEPMPPPVVEPEPVVEAEPPSGISAPPLAASQLTPSAPAETPAQPEAKPESTTPPAPVPETPLAPVPDEGPPTVAPQVAGAETPSAESASSVAEPAAPVTLRAVEARKAPAVRVEPAREAPTVRAEEEQKGPTIRVEEAPEAPTLRVEEEQQAPAVRVEEVLEAPTVHVEEVWQVPAPIVAADREPAPSDSAVGALPEVDPAVAPEPEEGPLETGEGQLMASLPPEGERPTPVEPEVQEFLDDWARSIQELDYGIYKKLGFGDSRRKFKRRFEGHEDPAVRFERIEVQGAPGGDLRLSVLMIYSYTERGSRKEREKLRRIVLHPAQEGLRYVEAWN